MQWTDVEECIKQIENMQDGTLKKMSIANLKTILSVSYPKLALLHKLRYKHHYENEN